MPKSSGSLKKTSLSTVEQYELNQWLRDNQVYVSNLRRSFTDVHPLARLMARYYPNLIDLNYYPPRNSVQNKLCNWESFNNRVLARLNLGLTREQMIRVARSEPGSVDLLLYSVMRMAERQARLTKEREEAEQAEIEAKAEAENEKAKAAPVAAPVSETKPDVLKNMMAKATESILGKGLSEAKDINLVAKSQKLNPSPPAIGRNKKPQATKDQGSVSRFRVRQTPAATKRR